MALLAKAGLAISRNKDAAKQTLDKYGIDYKQGTTGQLISAFFKGIKDGNKDLANDLAILMKADDSIQSHTSTSSMSKETRGHIFDQLKAKLRDRLDAVKTALIKGKSNADGDVPVDPSAADLLNTSTAIISELGSKDLDSATAEATDGAKSAGGVSKGSFIACAIILIIVIGLLMYWAGDFTKMK